MGKRESPVEDYLVEQVEARGGMCEKKNTPGRKGCPDRLVTWPMNRMFLVETKAPKGKLSIAQQRDHARRGALGVYVHVCYSRWMVDRFIEMTFRFQ